MALCVQINEDCVSFDSILPLRCILFVNIVFGRCNQRFYLGIISKCREVESNREIVNRNQNIAIRIESWSDRIATALFYLFSVLILVNSKFY